MRNAIISIAATVAALSASAVAAPVVVGGYTFDAGADAFATSATFISGSTSGFDGVTCEEGIVGSDIDTGCFNLDPDDVLRLDYGTSFQNGAGDDLVFTDSRFSIDGLDFSLDGTNFFSIAASSFTDTGVNSVIRGTTFGFDLFAAAIDLSDFGIAANAVFSSIWIRGTGQSDPIFVGALNSMASDPVPLPGAALLFASGLLGVHRIRRRRTA